MYKYLFFSLFLSSISFSQTQCKNNVSTDYLNPTNSSLDNFPEFLNGFNWLEKNPQGYVKYPLDNMSFNYYDFYEMDNILSSNHSAYDYIKNSLLPLHKNGWELLGVNLGRYPDGTTLLAGINYLIIYLIYIFIIDILE